MDRVSTEQPSNQRVYPHCRNTKMKKVLFGRIGAGLAVGGAYFLYKKWQKYQQQCQEKTNEVCNTLVNKGEVERNLRLQLLSKKGSLITN